MSNNIISSLMGSTSGIASTLSDYNLIKSGSYGKLMKSYYGSISGTSSASTSSTKKSGYSVEELIAERHNPSTSEEVTKANASLSSSVSNLKSSLSSLQSENTYKDDTTGAATDARTKVSSALSNYVSSFNDALESSKKSTNNAVSSNLAQIMKQNSANADSLKEIGITVNNDGSLYLDSNRLKNVDITEVQDLFSTNDATGYGASVKSRLDRASYYTSTASASTAATDDAASANTTTSSAKDLKSSISNILDGTVFKGTTDKDGKTTYDRASILSTAQDLVKNYNDVVTNASSSINSGVSSNLAALKQKTSSNSVFLKAIGINVGADDKLSLDTDKFGTSDVKAIKTALQTYAGDIETNASLLNYYSSTQNGTSSAYGATGSYSASDIVNSLYNGVS